jgi:3-oxoacyl-[acyl-carrier-protein] synthase-3
MARPTSGFGIIGMGMDVPSTVRTNDWWPESFVRRFESRAQADITTPEVRLDGDPFRGSKERRIAGADEKTSDYVFRAASRALADAQMDAHDLDCILAYSIPSDEATPGDGFLVQNRLGAKRASVIQIDTGCASFLTGLALADAMLGAGQVASVLVVVAALGSHITDWDDPVSVNFGDGAAAAVVAAVPPGTGFVGHAAGTDGSKYAGVTCGPKSDVPWYRGSGPFYLHSRNVAVGRTMVMGSTEYAELAVQEVLAHAGLTREGVTHLYCHQPACWFNAACRRALHLEHCATMDTFAEYASLGAANLGVNLVHARQLGQLERGSVVLMFSFGMGMAWASSLLRWSC